MDSENRQKHNHMRIEKPGRYYGICTGGQLPYGTIHKELDRIETVRGRVVKYYHVWVKETEMKPIFKENEEPNHAKISMLTKLFRSIFGE